MIRFLFICLLVTLVAMRDDPKYDQIFGNKHPTTHVLNQQQYWFDQIVDHYDYHNLILMLVNDFSVKKSQIVMNYRYFKQSQYYSYVQNISIKKSFLLRSLLIAENWLIGIKNYSYNQLLETKILGRQRFLQAKIRIEWICQGVPSTRLWSGILARKLNGIVIGLQHRFYGASLPFGKDSFSLENMKFLSSELALKDIAYFIQTVKANNMFGITDQPWVIVGGSYAGALVAWFRYKYPHLVIASIASSAVINAIQNFQQFDQQIYLSSHKSGDFCSQALKDVSDRVQQILQSGQDAALNFKSQFFGGQHLNNKEFLFFWADSIVMPIQYGSRVQFCEGLKGKTADQQLDYLVQNAKKIEVYEYSSYYLKNQTFTYQTQSSSRPWYYQYCTEYGWFQTFSSKHPIRSKQLTLDFYRQFCEATYGNGTWAKVSRKNNEYGGLKLATSKIIFSNGGQDPWRWASLQYSNSKDVITRVVDCDNTAHCADLRTPSDTDCQTLIDTRIEQYSYLKAWIAEYWFKSQRKTSRTY